MDIDLRVTTIILLVVTLCSINLVSSCPRMQCAPIISKCQLIDACRCEAQLDYSCHKNCSHCLGDLYPECCSCVGVCPSYDETKKPAESHVKMFEATNDELFDLFVGDGDYSDRWNVYTLPVSTANSTVTANCSMAFLSSCVDIYKCESSCLAMGAYAYRWFHVGCCECVGRYCPNFGVNDMRCRYCPSEGDQVIDSGEI